jgi:phage-related protein
MSLDGKNKPFKAQAQSEASLRSSEHRERRLAYMPACKKMLLTFPEKIREGMAFALRSLSRNPSEVLGATLLRHGYPGFDIKRLTSIRAKVAEIRAQDAQHWFRLAYTTEFQDCLFALHAFLKKTNDTAMQDRDLILQRARGAAVLYRDGECR